jgi:phosphoglycolate phosphatase
LSPRLIFQDAFHVSPFLPHRIAAVLFDLDGTLVDTAPDLGGALNAMRHKRGLAAIPAPACRAQSSHGARGLLKLGFDVEPQHPDFSDLRQEFLDVYATILTRNSPLFDGVAEVLAALNERAIKWGIVTNKPACYTQPLVEHLGLAERAAFIVSGDTCGQPKPHPEPVLHACRVANVAVNACIYVGDAERDIQAANAAGMPALVAMYGYLDAADQPGDWGARGFIHAPADLLAWV